MTGEDIIPRGFIVPEGSLDWPESMWTLRLGSFFREIKRGRSYRHRKDELIAEGFNLDQNTHLKFKKKYGSDDIFGALMRYKEINGDFQISTKYIVPSTNDWKQEFWGLQLGRYCTRVRMGECLVKRKQELIDEGFNYKDQVIYLIFMLYCKTYCCKYRNVSFINQYNNHYIFNSNQRVRYGYDLTVVALKKYKAIHGNLDIPKRFIVPKDDIWPKGTWNMTLGKFINFK